MHNFMAHIDGGSVQLQRTLDNINGSIDARAKSARLGQNQLYRFVLRIANTRHHNTPNKATSTRRSAPASGRSEEHTSELQSLMRTSYAVFCLKKKTPKSIQRHNIIMRH